MLYNSKTTNVPCGEHTLLYAAYRSGMEEVMNIEEIKKKIGEKCEKNKYNYTSS